MKKWMVVFFAVLIFQKWEVVDSYLHPLPDYVSEHKVDMVMYVKKQCEACDESRAFMEANNISFYEYNIDKSVNGKSQYDVLNGDGVPLLLSNGMKIQGFHPEKILSLAKGSDGLLGRLGF